MEPQKHAAAKCYSSAPRFCLHLQKWPSWNVPWRAVDERCSACLHAQLLQLKLKNTCIRLDITGSLIFRVDIVEHRCLNDCELRRQLRKAPAAVAATTMPMVALTPRL